MIIRATRAKFGPMTKRYKHGEFQRITQEIQIDLDNTDNVAKRGVAAGLDNSHSKDYKVSYVSDPLIIVYTTNPNRSHEELQKQLKHLDLWNYSLNPIELPRTGENGEPTWVAGFKTLPRDSNRIDQFKDTIEQASEGMCFTSDNDVEAHIPDLQKRLSTFDATSETQQEEASTAE